MKLAFIVSECAPLAKVGGLADVAASLPKALKEIKTDVSVILPFYQPIKIENIGLIKENIPLRFKNKEDSFNLYRTFLSGSNVPLYLVANKEYISGGGIYPEEDASSGGTIKEAERFLFFSLAVIETAKILKTNILHCHDWHAAIIPYLVKKNGLPFKTIMTIHNLGYQGRYGKEIVNQLLNENFREEVNCLRLGIQQADIVTTVSQNYAKEILTAQFGFGLENDLAERKGKLFGIVNGLDDSEFNPETDSFLYKNYSLNSFHLRKENREFLIKNYFQGKITDQPVLGIISRLTDQKGIDLIKELFPVLMKEGFRFILLGKGLKVYETFFEKMAKKYPQLFFAKIGFNEKLARQVYAGADIFLMPSFYEPCGLGQLIAMKYGSVPVARATGGIKDTIINAKFKMQNAKLIVKGTGFLFEEYNSQEFLKAIRKATAIFKNKNIWEQIQRNGMSADFSWQKSAKEYLKIYQRLI